MRAIFSSFLCLATAFFISGCASKPRPLASEAAAERIPGLQEQTPPETPLDVEALWVRDFQDPELDNLITATLQNNPDVTSAAAQLRAAMATTRIVGAERMPQVAGQFSANRGRTVNQFNFPGSGETIQTQTANRFDLGVNLSWEVDLWGRLADAQQAALFDQDASAAQFAATRLALSTAVARAWFQAQALSIQQSIAEKLLEVAERSLRATEDRVNRGLIGSLELSLARSQVEGAKAELESRIREKRNAIRLVQTLAGAYPDGQLTPEDHLPVLEDPPPAFLPAEMLARRPDLIAASLNISAADSRVSEAEKSLIPSISLTGSFGTASNELSDLLDSNFSVWNIAGSLLQPLFQGGRLRAEVERREALLAVSIADFESALLTALREVEDALDSDAYLREAALRSAEAARLAQEAASVGFDRYERGLIDLLDVLELQNRAFDAYNFAVNLRLAALLNRIDLYAALGGGFEPPIPVDQSLSQNP